MLMPTLLSVWEVQIYMFKEMLGDISFRIRSLIPEFPTLQKKLAIVHRLGWAVWVHSHLKADVLMETFCVCLRCRRM